MERVTIWQCRDDCCAWKPHSKRWWHARSRDFQFHEQVSTWKTAAVLTAQHFQDA